MRQSRKAFTLLELMIAISILSLMMIFLYKSYSTLNISNKILQKETISLTKMQKIKKMIYLDFLTALPKSVVITKRDKKEDFVSLQTAHSIHQRFNPYVVYLLKNKNLYRLESLKQIKTYDLSVDDIFDVDKIGQVNTFRVYKSSDSNSTKFLIDIDFKGKNSILLKINF